MGNEFSVITPDIKRSIIREDGTELDFFTALGGNNAKKLRDEDVVNIINDDDVNPARITKITLAYCTSITDKTLIAIADTCHNLTWLIVGYCSNNVTGAGLDAIARKCRKLQKLDAYSCNISHLPEDIGMLLLPHLTLLSLFDNYIQKIPASLPGTPS
jgi:Leucine-rich repeat (LRR) protein